MSPVSLTLPWCPSVNTYWRNLPNGRVLISEQGRRYRRQVVSHCYGIKRLECRLAVRIWAYPPDRRKRDIDNLPKSILDSLCHGGVFLDDSQIDELCIYRRPCEGKPGRVEIEVTPIETGQLALEATA